MKDKRIAHFILSIVMLIVGMTVGFVLLSLAYTGPRWVVFIFFLIFFLIAYLVIRFSSRFVRELRDGTKSNNT